MKLLAIRQCYLFMDIQKKEKNFHFQKNQKDKIFQSLQQFLKKKSKLYNFLEMELVVRTLELLCLILLNKLNNRIT